jgi:hypothetical protein
MKWRVVEPASMLEYFAKENSSQSMDYSPNGHLGASYPAHANATLRQLHQTS